jgi:hypothetical protein
MDPFYVLHGLDAVRGEFITHLVPALFAALRPGNHVDIGQSDSDLTAFVEGV